MTARQHPLASIASPQLSAEIDPLGAQLFALRDGDGRDLLWNGDPAFWTGRAPILFPIVGMLQDGQYRVDGATYHLEKHGFARHALFELTEKSAAAATFRLRADEKTLPVYPFRFELQIRFAIEASTLSATASVTNVDDKEILASFGFHPALRWPLPYGALRSDHAVTFEKAEPAPIRRINSEGVVKPDAYPTPVQDRTLALRDDLFVDDALIFDRIESQKLRYGAEDGPHMEIEFPQTPYLGVWTKPGADFICIEPWHGLADPEGFKGDFREKPGVFNVPKGETRRFHMAITLRK